MPHFSGFTSVVLLVFGTFCFFIQTGQFGLTGNKVNEKEATKIGKDHKPGFDLTLSKVQLHCMSEHCPQGQRIYIYVYFAINQIDLNKS